MHGLINRSIQCFLRDTYGEAAWREVARRADIGLDNFEAMLIYDIAVTDRVIDAAAALLERPRDGVLDDFGTYLVSHPNLERLRRLLRFGGVSFVDFLHSLDDLPDRARLALPDLDLPLLELQGSSSDCFRLACRSPLAGAGHVIVGLLRAMADDYGALVLLEHEGSRGGAEIVAIHLLETRFAAGRRFDLAALGG